MDADHRKALGIDDLMTVVHTDFKNQSRKGEDTDIDYYDVFAPDGTLIAKCEIHEAMGVYPPHNKRTIYKKYSPEGASLL